MSPWYPVCQGQQRFYLQSAQISQEFTLFKFVYDCQRYFEQNVYRQRQNSKKIGLCIHVLWSTQNMVIPCCCFINNGKDVYLDFNFIFKALTTRDLFTHIAHIFIKDHNDKPSVGRFEIRVGSNQAIALVLVLVLVWFVIGWVVLLVPDWFGFGFTTLKWKSTQSDFF